MKKTIDPIDVSLIKAELTPDKFLRYTNKANNELYIFSASEAPNTMLEVGRLREIAFRANGGGTGAAYDIDHYDTMQTPFQQLIVWNPDAEEIIGGYRFFLGSDVHLNENGQPIELSIAHLFRFSEKFISDYIPYTIELGRSFVNADYQVASAGSKGLFALDNLWDGLGALTHVYPDYKYFFGKVTMYPDFGGRDLILAFLDLYFEDKDNFAVPYQPLQTGNLKEIAKMFDKGNYKEDFKVLNSAVRNLGLNIPPLVNAYMNLSSTMKVFGSTINDECGNVEDTGILITTEEIFPEKKTRHIDTFVKEESGFMKKRTQ